MVGTTVLDFTEKENSQYGSKLMKVQEISDYLNIPLYVVTGLARAGFFGYSSKSGHFKKKSVLNFEKYGVQWDASLPPRLVPQTIEPIIPGWENPPAHTLSYYSISISNDGTSKCDTHWIANFFFKVNKFYFPQHDAIQQAYPTRIKLHNKFVAQAEGTTVFVYPDESGKLALIQVIGKGNPHIETERAFVEAKNKITPILNWITMRTDNEAKTVQENIVGLPSGTIYFKTSKAPPETILIPEEFVEQIPLRDAKSLYRTGLNCNEPMYTFLSFWRACEAIESIQKDWINKYRIRLSENEEFSALIKEYSNLKIPIHPVFGEQSGKKINNAATNLRDRFRNAIAHAHTLDRDNILTGSDEASHQKMQSAIATLRYIVKTKIDALDKILETSERILKNNPQHHKGVRDTWN